MKMIAREILILLISWVVIVISDESFDLNFQPKWGNNHISQLQGGTLVQLLLDPTGGAGFISKNSYCSGVFTMKMKIPEQKTRGIIISFYLISKQNVGNHDELDFEFISTKGLLQTNIFANDGGNREQKVDLGFDPSQDFHTYQIDFNSRRVEFRVDNRVVRVFPNNGGNYITKPLHVEASIWNATWAGEVAWNSGPFKTYYSGFNIAGTVCNY